MKNDHPTRSCKKCGESKPIEEFPRYGGKDSDGRRHECKTCNKARVEAHHQANKGHRLARAKERYAANPAAHWTPERRARANELARINGVELRNEVLSVYGMTCACCGEAEKRFLTIDHVNNDGKDMRKIHGTGSSFYRWLKRHKFPGGFQTLCMNCNFGKAMNNGICPHLGTEGSTTIPQGSTAKRLEMPRARPEQSEGGDIVCSA